MSAYLHGVQYHLPDTVVTNEDLVRRNPAWNAEAIYAKTGIRQRRVAGPGETAADLGLRAAERLLQELQFDRGRIDTLLFCTQSPDYFLPATACTLQQRLDLPTTCGALDFNQGCSGFTYGLWLSRALIESGSAHNVLLIVGDTYSRYCRPDDLTTVTIFGDGAGATLIRDEPGGAIAAVGPSVVGTDGRGAAHLIVEHGAARMPAGKEGPHDKCPGAACLHMNGPEVFSFTMRALKSEIERLLMQLGIGWGDVNMFLFHQASKFLLESLQRALKIAPDKMPIDIEEIGNTVSATLPILMRRLLDSGRLPAGRCLLVGFGVGYSWGVTELTVL